MAVSGWLQGVVMGIVATMLMDVWAAIAKHLLRLPTANWAMVGRWFGHMRRGVIVHQSMANAAPIRNELALGWAGHYLIGVFYGLTYLYIVQTVFSVEPSLVSALGFGLATLFAPWLILQPAMGAGVFAGRTPNPATTRLVNVSMHAVFGASLYIGWLLIR
jgi:Protein of unknown function (DUF2938)